MLSILAERLLAVHAKDEAHSDRNWPKSHRGRHAWHSGSFPSGPPTPGQAVRVGMDPGTHPFPG